jgi:hypothetical protein
VQGALIGIGMGWDGMGCRLIAVRYHVVGQAE